MKLTTNTFVKSQKGDKSHRNHCRYIREVLDTEVPPECNTVWTSRSPTGFLAYPADLHRGPLPLENSGQETVADGV